MSAKESYRTFRKAQVFDLIRWRNFKNANYEWYIDMSSKPISMVGPPTKDPACKVTISNHTFVSEVFRDDAFRCHVTGFAEDPTQLNALGLNHYWGGGAWQDMKGLTQPDRNNFFCISVFDPDPHDGKHRRRKVNFAATYCIVFDDVNLRNADWDDTSAKVDADKIILPPSWTLETSPNNFQVGYIFTVPEVRSGKVNALLDALVSSGLVSDGSDPGMKGVTRYVRLPVGRNTKAKYGVGGFEHKLMHWEPDAKYTIEQIASAYGIAHQVEDAPDDASVGAAPVTVDADDDWILRTLRDTGSIHSEDKAKSLWHITCPFVEEHSQSEDTGSAYLGAGMFKCHHGHCLDRKHQDFVDKLERDHPVMAAKVKHDVAVSQFNDGTVFEDCDDGKMEPSSAPKTPVIKPPLDLPCGLVGALMQHVSQTSRRQGLEFHSGAALVAVAAASEGLFVVDRDAGPTALNMQAVLIAGTGVGKESDRNLIQKVLDDTRTFYADGFASSQGLHRQLSQTRSVAYMNDEFGRMLEAILSGKNSFQQEIITLTIRLYGLALGKLTPVMTKDPKNALPDVSNPFLTVFHTTTRDVMSAFSSRDVSNGVLNRPLFVLGPDHAPLHPRGHIAPRDMPPDILKALASLKTLKDCIDGLGVPANDEDALSTVSPPHTPTIRSYGNKRAVPIIPTAEAEDAIYDWQDEVEKELAGRNATSDLWSRAVENSLKVAGVVALGELAFSAPCKFSGHIVMEKAHVEWAVAFVRRCVTDQIALVEHNLADSPAHEHKLLIMRKLKEAGGECTRRDLSRKTQKLSATQRDDALNDLVASGIVKYSKSASNGRAKGTFRLVS